MTGNWNYPTPIRFGAGRVRELPAACAELHITRPLIVTDPGLVAIGLVDHAVQPCVDHGLPVKVFSDLRPNPVDRDVAAGLAAYSAGDCDGIIAFGGGSAIDVAKAVALMVGQKRPMWDFEDVGDNWRRVDQRGMAPVVAVPTTSGTGAEVGRSSVITRARDHRKAMVFHPNMMPGRVICDPELTLGLPAAITAAVGMDALSHNLEAYCTPGFHPQADGIALEGVRLVFRALTRAVEDGTDLEARAFMMAASLMGATAFQKGLGAMHALSHPIGAVLDAHHGLTNAVVMPYVLRFNQRAVDDRLAVLAQNIGAAATSSGFIDAVERLREHVGIPNDLTALGMTEEHVDQLAPMAHRDPTAPGNPVPLTIADCADLYRAALAG